MAKRKRDLEELKQFIKLASRESRYSKGKLHLKESLSD